MIDANELTFSKPHESGRVWVGPLCSVGDSSAGGALLLLNIYYPRDIAFRCGARN